MFAFFTKVQNILGKVIPAALVLAGVIAVVVLVLAVFGVVPFYTLFVSAWMSISVLGVLFVLFIMSDEGLDFIENK